MDALRVLHATVLATMDRGTEFPDGGLTARAAVTHFVGRTADLPASPNTVVDIWEDVVGTGLVKTQHLYQSLARTVPDAQTANLFNCPRTLHPIWGRLKPQAVAVFIQIDLTELPRSGCT